jgi:molybdopterin molybdotransferase
MLKSCDVIIISGGSSKGKEDATADVINMVADPGVFVHGVALKPGKPTILGIDKETETLLVGLPGHPVSAMIVFELFLCWLYRQMVGKSDSFSIPATLTNNVSGSPGKTTCQPVKLDLLAEKHAQGVHAGSIHTQPEHVQGEHIYAARPVFGKSGLISTLADADGYFIIERNQEGVRAGQSVLVHLF